MRKQLFVSAIFPILFLLVGCKPETARSPIATPQMALSPLATPLPSEVQPVQTLPLGIPPSVDNIWAVPSRPVVPMPIETNMPHTVHLPTTLEPTPTMLPDSSVHMSTPTRIRSITGKWAQLFVHDFDNHDLVGVIHNGNASTVMTVNIENSQTRVITTSQTWIYTSRIAGRYVAWLAAEYEDAREVLVLYAQNLPTSQTLRIATAVDDIDLSGSVVVMRALTPTGDNWDIWGYDLVQQKSFPIITKPGTQFGPKISGRWVVYQDATDNDEIGVGLHGINLDTGKDIRLGSIYAASDQYVPSLYSVDAPWVVWSTGTWSNQPELHFYNLDTGSTYTETVASCSQHEQPGRLQNLALSGNTLIFSGCYQDLGYDLEKKVFFSLPIYTPEMQGSMWASWAMFGDQLVWTRVSGSSGQQESLIYTARIIRGK